MKINSPEDQRNRAVSVRHGATRPTPLMLSAPSHQERQAHLVWLLCVFFDGDFHLY